jgi:hypothetical protein
MREGRQGRYASQGLADPRIKAVQLLEERFCRSEWQGGASCRRQGRADERGMSRLMREARPCRVDERGNAWRMRDVRLGRYASEAFKCARQGSSDARGRAGQKCETRQGTFARQGSADA